MKRRTSHLALPEYVALALAAVIAYSYYFAWLDVPIIHDAAGYLRAAQDIARNGLFSKYDLSSLRTYAWPWLLSAYVRVAEFTGVPLRLIVFHGNLLFFLASCVVLHRALNIAGASARVARLGFFAVVLNPLVLIYPGYLLTESLSFSLVILLLSASVMIVSPFGKDRFLALTGAGSLLLGLAIMTRPGNLAMLPVWGAAMVLGFLRHRPGLPRAASAFGLALVCLAGSMTPQFVNNVRHYGRVTPLLADDFSQGGQSLGVRAIKYATSHLGNSDPQVYYWNPFYGNEPLSVENPLAWYWQHPVKGATTIGLHVFNLLDQDLPFPYNPTLLPKYYPAAATANMFVVACGLIGLFVAGRLVIGSWRDARPYYLIAVIMLVFQVAMHMFFAVEARWGVPALIVLYMFAVFFIADWLPAATPRQRTAALLLACALTAAAYPLSHWVRRQAPAIQAALQLRRDVGLIPGVTGTVVPGRRFVSGELTNWTLHLAGVGHDDEAILYAPRVGDISGITHPVTLEKNTVYQVEFDAKAIAGVTSELSVDLYWVAYDSNDQNSFFTSFEKTYTHFKAQWNSGPDAPHDALLRFVTVSTSPVQVRNVVFSKLTQR